MAGLPEVKLMAGTYYTVRQRGTVQDVIHPAYETPAERLFREQAQRELVNESTVRRELDHVYRPMDGGPLCRHCAQEESAHAVAGPSTGRAAEMGDEARRNTARELGL